MDYLWLCLCPGPWLSAVKKTVQEGVDRANVQNASMGSMGQMVGAPIAGTQPVMMMVQQPVMMVQQPVMMVQQPVMMVQQPVTMQQQ